MALLELITGLLAARYKGQRWSSRKFSRFGLKILVWLCLFLICNLFTLGYQTVEGVSAYTIHTVFSWLHGILVSYVSFEYLISIIENISKITGKSNNRLIKLLNKKLDGILGEQEK
jgi:phage-related holin